MRRVLLLIFITIIPFFTECDFVDYWSLSEPINNEEIYGIYKANFPEIYDILELRIDTTYRHYTKYADGSECSDSGFWRLRSDDFSIIPEVASKYAGSGIWRVENECSHYEITFYEFRKTDYTVPGYESNIILPADTGKFSWCTCFYKRKGKMEIKINHSFLHYYIKADSI